VAEVTARLWMPKLGVTDDRYKRRAYDGWAKLTEGVALGGDLPGFLAKLAGRAATAAGDGGGVQTVVTTQGTRDAITEFFRELGTMVIRDQNDLPRARYEALNQGWFNLAQALPSAARELLRLLTGGASSGDGRVCDHTCWTVHLFNKPNHPAYMYAHYI
jgi:hypothetical protein